MLSDFRNRACVLNHEPRLVVERVQPYPIGGLFDRLPTLDFRMYRGQIFVGVSPIVIIKIKKVGQFKQLPST